jgi:hypothetical protein
MKELTKQIQQQLDKMYTTGKLFRSTIPGDVIWDSYIQGFGNDPIFRDPESSVHNCKLCNNFIRRYGNIVSIDTDYKIMTIWDLCNIEEYKASTDSISSKLKSSPIGNVFFETFQELNSLPYETTNKNLPKFKLGIDRNVKRYTREEAEKFGMVKPNELREFHHLYMYIPTQFVDKSGKSEESLMGDFRSFKDVFKRGLEEISVDTLFLVKDLINQDSLLDGKTHLFKIEAMIKFKKDFDQLPLYKRDNYSWVNAYNNQLAKFRNELIGTLCVDLTEGKELNEACQTWNKRVDPSNYMKAKAPITKKQIEEAKKFVEENGYEQSFDRRFATIDDIKASEILHLNCGDGVLKSVSIFDSVKATSTRHKKSEFNNVEEIHIDKFMSDILPTCTSVEVFLQNNHEGNLVSLTTANISDSKRI